MRNPWGWAARIGVAPVLVLLTSFAWHMPALGGELDLTWTDNSSDEAGFSVERSTNRSGAFAEIATTAPDVTAYTDASVADGTTYCYRVRAFNAAGYSDYSNAVCATTPQIFGLAVVKVGAGSGLVTSSPTGIQCGPSCSSTYPSGTLVTLSGTAATGSIFSGWSGPCTGTGSCTVTVTAATAVTAAFDLPPASLTVKKSGAGGGTVTSTPAGINCGSTCSTNFPNATNVTLIATPAAGSTFSGWTGACTGNGPCVVSMTAAATVTASFDLPPTALTVTKTGNGNGSVVSSPPGIDCGATCSSNFPRSTAVTLTANPASGSNFSGWSGGGCTGTGSCVVSLSAATTVSAAFLTAVPDVQPPSVAITVPTQALAYTTNASPLSLTGTSADDVAVAQVSWANNRGGGGTASGTTSWSVSGITLQSGINVLTVTARDTSGNAGTASLTVTYDPTAPTVTLVAPAAGATVSGTVNISAVAADNVGVVGVQLLLDGLPLGSEQISPLSTTWDTTSVPNGTHTLSAKARDAAGNTAIDVHSVTVSNPPATDLVAAIGFNEGTGTFAADSSGNGNTGTLTGATWTTAGRFGNALIFNGASAYVDVGNGPTMQLKGSTTISAWVRPTAFPRNDAAIVSKRTVGNLGYQLDTTVDTGARTIGFKLTNANGSKMARYGATVLQLNQWYYVTGVYDAGAATLDVYLNGQLDNGTLIGTVTAAQQDSPLNVNIGRRAGASGYAFSGVIDEVRLYRRALSAAEIRRDMAAAIAAASPPSTAPTIAITSPTSAVSYAAHPASSTRAGTAADHTGMARLGWSNNRVGSTSGTTNRRAADIGSSAGRRRVERIALDAAGNRASTALPIRLPTATRTASVAGTGSGGVNSAPAGIGRQARRPLSAERPSL